MMKQNYLKSLFLMLMMCVCMGAWAEVTDVLDQTVTEVSGTTYKDFTSSILSSGATYVGNCAGDKGSIQLRSSNNNSGIVTKTSGGKVKKITINWNSDTAEGRTLNVYGKNGAYTSASDLYDTSKQGTLLGSIKKGTSTEYELTTEDGNITYIGLRSNSGAMYITSISITWDNGTTTEPTTTYNVTVANDIANGTVTANPTSAAEGATVTLTATPATGYEFGSWNVTNASTSAAITVTDNKFTMPAANVNVSATFNTKPSRPADEIFYESFDTNDGTGGNDDKWSGSIASNKIQQDNDGWVFENGSGANECAKFGAGSKLGTATTPALGQACNATLTFKAAAWNANNENTTLKLSLVGEGTISPSTVTLTKGSWETYSVTLTGIDADTKIKFEGNAASNSRFFLDEVSVLKTGEASVTLSSISVKTAPTKVTYTEGDYFDPTGLVITKTMSNNATEDVAYAGNEDNFSFEPSLTTILKASNTGVVITYDSKTATQTITVNPSAIKNTPETAYTTAEAIGLINAGEGLATEVYVKGTVSKVDSYNKNYKSITYWLDDNSFEIYSGKGLNNTDFASQEDIQVGAEVVVYGLIKKFVKDGQDDTYEMDKNNYLVSYTSPASETTYTISVKEEIFNGSVTVSTTEAKAGETVTITATPEEGYEVEEYIAYSTENSATEVTVTADGTFIMPAYDVTVNVLFKEKQGGETPDTPDTPVVGEGVTYSFAMFDKADDVTFEANGFTITLHKNTGSTAPQWNGNSNEARLYAKGSIEVTSTKNIVKVVYDYAENTGGKNNIAPTIDGVEGKTNAGTWDATTKTWTGKDNTVTLTTSGSAGNLGFKSITVYFEEEAAPTNGTITFAATDGTDYYATFSSDRVVAFEDVMVGDGDESMASVKAYGVFVIDGSLVLTDLYDTHNDGTYTYIPKNTGVLLKYHIEEGTMPLAVPFKYADEWDGYLDDISSDNMLVPCTTTGVFKAEADGNMYYKLAYGDYTNKTKLGFWWGAEDGSGNFKVKAGGAVLCVPQATATSVKGFSFDMAKDEDAIKGVEQKTFDTVIYDMQGRKVSKTQKGLYIINGRKMVK